MVIHIGINDVWHSLLGRGPSKEDYEPGLKRIIQQIQEAGARVILATPGMVGEKTDGSNLLDTMLEEYSTISRQVATDTGSQLLDLRKLFVAAALEALVGGPAADKLLRHVVLKDDVTPEQVQEVVMAFAALRGKIDTIVAFEHGFCAG